MSRSPSRFSRRRVARRHSLTRSERGRHQHQGKDSSASGSGYFSGRSAERSRRHDVAGYSNHNHYRGTTSHRNAGLHSPPSAAYGGRRRSRTPPPSRSARHGAGGRVGSRSISSSSSGVWRGKRGASRRGGVSGGTHRPGKTSAIEEGSSSTNVPSSGTGGDKQSSGKSRNFTRRKRRRSSSVSSVDSDILVKSSREEVAEKGRLREQKVIDEEVNRRVEMEVQKRVEDMVKSDVFQKQLQDYMKMERARAEAEMNANLEKEKRQILDDFRRQEMESQQKSQQLEDILIENERKIREQQVKLAKEQAKRDEERLLELQTRQQQVDFEVRRRKSRGSTTTATSSTATSATDELLKNDIISVNGCSADASSPERMISSGGISDTLNNASPSKVKMTFKFHKGAAQLFE